MIGIDEVGRGAWAGPLLVAAVRLHAVIPGLTDSKLLTLKQREILANQIQASANIGLGWISAPDVDKLGLTEALKQASQEAIRNLDVQADEEIIIDGTVNFLPHHQHVTTAIKAELAYPCVAAASVVAKVFRDRYMAQLHQKAPEYHFASHVGYGTKLHHKSLKEFGVSPWHRRSYKPVKLIADATMTS